MVICKLKRKCHLCLKDRGKNNREIKKLQQLLNSKEKTGGLLTKLNVRNFLREYNNMSQIILKLTKLKLQPEETLRLTVKSMFQQPLKSHLLSGLGVLINSTHALSEFSDFWDFDNSTMVLLWESTRQPLISSEELNPTSLLGNISFYIRYPSRETIKKLVYKRGYGKINRQRIPLTNNKLVEDNLGKVGIASLEDLIN